jgi:hypothetical protein
MFGLVMLPNLGINVSTFIASLGIGGIAIALAAQNILGNLFASLSIAVQKPFEVATPSAWGVFGQARECRPEDHAHPRRQRRTDRDGQRRIAEKCCA